MIIEPPTISEKPEVVYMGIRTQAQFKGMFAVVDKLVKEMYKWMDQQELKLAGPPFLRYDVIDMKGEMDIEVGFPVEEVVAGDDRVKPSKLPAGRYAHLTYQSQAYSANSTLINWAINNGLKWDRWDDPKGDGFRSRYEAYLTDPKVEPRKTKWYVELAIKLADE